MFVKSLLKILMVGGFCLPAVAAKPPQDTFNPSDHCVAYQIKKTIAFVKSVNVVGKNCDISSEVIPEPGSQYHVEVTIPILSFESGEIERDRDVAKLLKAEQQKNLHFQSESLTKKMWQEKLQAESFDLKGQLSIAGENYPVTAKVQFLNRVVEGDKLSDEKVILGVIQANLSELNIQPPKLWGGIGASVSKEVELMFQLVPGKTMGTSFLMSPALN